MNYISVREAAEKWSVSERMVTKYCVQGRIIDAYQEFGIWYIPENAAKPTRKKKEASQLPKLLKTLIKQRDGRLYRGLYEYLQINMVYSNGRMASNRLTRDQVEVLYKTDRIFTNNESIKVNDIIEARNHFLCVDMILSNAMKPLTQTFIQQLQSTLLSESCRHKRHAPIASGYRKTTTTPKFGKTTPPTEIPAAINQLFKEYEAQKDIGFHEILDLHVRFERIRPFEDCNGRIGRLLMLKECLRYEVTPFVIDDKRRTGYLDGIRQWDEDRSILMDVCMEAQMRFEAQIALQGLLECQSQHMRAYHKGGNR
ncbi:MAG: Fic family protein [Firmicutes bacterium]|nr:Fic family protein [Bacillota bacterium]